MSVGVLAATMAFSAILAVSRIRGNGAALLAGVVGLGGVFGVVVALNLQVPTTVSTVLIVFAAPYGATIKWLRDRRIRERLMRGDDGAGQS